jgi:hypothetical protein
MKQEIKEVAHPGNRNQTGKALISRQFWNSPSTGTRTW